MDKLFGFTDANCKLRECEKNAFDKESKKLLEVLKKNSVSSVYNNSPSIFTRGQKSKNSSKEFISTSYIDYFFHKNCCLSKIRIGE